MPQIRPFKGILYNPEKVPHLKDVITPPYDVISEKEQDEYYAHHPQSMIRLVLGKMYPQDTAQDNRYTRAGKSFRSWLDAGILRPDLKPALYVTEIDFELDGEIRTRFAFIARVRLESLESGVILPHEKTFSNVKADRLKLMHQCKANFSPIFSLYPDPESEIVGLVRGAVKTAAPDLEFTDLKGYRHRLWRCTDPGIHEAVGQRMADRLLYLADGHHRYETALRYRDLIMARAGSPDPGAPCNFVMMSLCSMEDAGLVIRPVHRVICDVGKETSETLVDSARAYFDIESLAFDDGNREDVEKAFLTKVKEGADRQAIGMVFCHGKAFHVLRVREKVLDNVLGQALPDPLKKLDVTLVTKLVLEGLLGLNGAALDDERRIMYTSRADKALRAVYGGKCPMVLILNPTRLDQIQKVSKAGLVMPRKSTYFYPKVMSGLVINKIDDD